MADDGRGTPWRSRRKFLSGQSDHELQRRLEEAWALRSASSGLSDAHPDLSARSGLTPEQKSGGWGLLGAGCVILFVAPEAAGAAAIVAASVVFGLGVLLRLSAGIAALAPPRKARTIRAEDDLLPTLTVLVALYREANVVSALIDAVTELDYPPARLDVKLLIEADDAETLDAVTGMRLPAHIEILPVPPGHPRTKPRALNYGLAFARGEIVTVFDAEDRPSPGQPREAVAALLAPNAPEAVQAPLLAHNGRNSWLAGQFQLEYAIHFLVWLPFLSRLGAPLALGGTSNYFRHAELVAVGGWDAWNVTEDADLGLRLARLGRRAATISQPTYEEAPELFRHWFDQRTRWMKGYLQTWLVLMRSPRRLNRELGPWRFCLLQATLGGALLASLLHGPIAIWMLIALLTPLAAVETWHTAFLGTGYASAVVAALASRQPVRLSSVLTMPLYWPLLSLAMARALWDLKRRPHHWAKTPHGGAGPSAPPDYKMRPYRDATQEDNVVQLPLPF